MSWGAPGCMRMSANVKVFGCRPHDDGATYTGAGVRKPALEETIPNRCRARPGCRDSTRNLLVGTRLIVPDYGCRPMSEQRYHRKNLVPALAGALARAFTPAKRLVRGVDQLDYLVRHWLTATHSPKRTRSFPQKDAWIPASGLPNSVQVAIGRGLRGEYSIDRSVPARLEAC